MMPEPPLLSRMHEWLRRIPIYCRWRLHASLLEWINDKIEVLERTAYGFHDDECFFLKIRQAFPGNET